jgi:hemolysin activation/secretion protein
MGCFNAVPNSVDGNPMEFSVNSTQTFTQPKLLSFSLVIFSALASSAAYAQVDAGALQRGIEKQLPLPSPLELPRLEAAPKGPSTQEKVDELRFTVSQFQLEGVKILPDSEIQELLKNWLGRPVSFSELQNACEAIQDLYRQRGYTVQAILPPQKIVGGIVKIIITEAKLGKVTVDIPSGDTRFGKERAAQYITYANPIGQPLNLQQIERAIVILNETPGVLVSSQLEPGQHDGEVDIRLQLDQPELLQSRVEANNYGSRTTGVYQGIFAATLNNPNGYGDAMTANGIASEGSQYVQAGYSLPGDLDGLRLGASATFLQYRNIGGYAYNGGTGDAWTAGLSAAYPLLRSQGINLNGTVNYDIKSYNNKNLATDAVISAYDINNLSAGLSGNFVDGFGAINTGSVNLVIGRLDILSSSDPHYSMYLVPNSSPANYQLITPASFVKINFSFNRDQQLLETGRTSLYTSISGQWASTNLNSAEQFYLGGPYGVRAYPVAQSGGSQGGILTMELRHQVQTKLTTLVFFDAGVVQQYKNTFPNWQGALNQSTNTYYTNANNTYSLMGAGMGVKWGFDNWNINATVAWKVGKNPLYSNTGQRVDTDGTNYQPRAWVSASYSF